MLEVPIFGRLRKLSLSRRDECPLPPLLCLGRNAQLALLNWRVLCYKLGNAKARRAATPPIPPQVVRCALAVLS